MSLTGRAGNSPIVLNWTRCILFIRWCKRTRAVIVHTGRAGCWRGRRRKIPVSPRPANKHPPRKNGRARVSSPRVRPPLSAKLLIPAPSTRTPFYGRFVSIGRGRGAGGGRRETRRTRSQTAAVGVKNVPLDRRQGESDMLHASMAQKNMNTGAILVGGCEKESLPE